jgi:hypothetical protein
MKKTTEERIKAYQETIDKIATDTSQILSTRQTNEDTRFCRWEGQSDDGRKHEEDIGDKALPFEGASDARVPTADMLINEHVDELVLAATRAIPKVVGMESTDEYRAGKMWAILKWLRESKWGSDFRDQMEMLANYVDGDTPAAAILWVDWVQERALEMKQLSVDDLMQEVMKEMGQEATEDMLVDLVRMCADPMREDELVTLLQNMFPNLSKGTAKKAAASLQRGEIAEFPRPYFRKNLPEMKALRLYEDVFLRPNIRDFQRAPEVFRREWLIKAEVEERAATENWDKEFVRQLIGDGEYEVGHEAESAFTNDSEMQTNPANGMDTLEPRDGMYELLTVYEYETDDDGVLGIWVTVCSGLINIPAKEPELFDRKHGKYPGVMFTREITGARRLDSRGVSEIVQTIQNQQKSTHDAVSDHVQVMTNPPIKTGRGAPKFQVTLAPFGQVEAGPREDVSFLVRPPFPEAARWMSDKLQRDINEYWGRPDANLPPSLAQIKSQARVDKFLGYLKDAYGMVIQLVQQYMTDEDIQRITNKGLVVARTVEEIQGQYDLKLSFDVRDLDMEFVKLKAEMYAGSIKALDTKATVQSDRQVQRLIEAIDPFAADEILVPTNVADEREIREERANFAKIVAGVEPEMTEGGINAQARIQVLQEMIGQRQQNPSAFYPLSPASQAILDNRMKYLQFQVQQQQNAITGKFGTEPVDTAQVGVEGEQ